MERQILAEIYPWESRIAVVEDSRLVEVFWANQSESVGNVYKCRVKDVIPGLSCAFVDIGSAKNAFLYASDMPLPGGGDKEKVFTDLIKSGQELLVQVKKEAFSEKGARVTGYITIPGHFLVLLPYKNEVSISRKINDDQVRTRLKMLLEPVKPNNIGLIVRTAAEEAEEEDLLGEMQELLQVWDEVQLRFSRQRAPSIIYEDIDTLQRTLRDYLDGDMSAITINNLKFRDKITEYMEQKKTEFNFKINYEEGDLFEKHNLEKDIRRALKRKIWLKSGGYLVFDQTEAMTVIDVNSGKYTGSTTLADTVLNLNLEAAAEIPRQLRLRSIGGIILVDFVDMANKEHENLVLEALRQELHKDKAHTRVVGMTGLGFLEMTRKKSRYGISEFFTEECAACQGRGRGFNMFALACEVRRKLANSGYLENPVIYCEAHPDLVQYLKNEEKYLRYIEHRTQKKLEFIADISLNTDEYRIISGIERF